jgi:DNA-binding response OmpR family regulator
LNLAPPNFSLRETAMCNYTKLKIVGREVKQMNILLIEDERQLSDALVALLKQCLHKVDAVYNGPDGENYAMTGSYDAIILDIMLPGKNGLEVLRSLREQGNSTPVLLLTAKTETEDKICGLDYGADYYLTKPFDSEELLACLRAITRRGVQLIGEVTQAGNTTLDKNTHELRTESGSFKLSVKEYMIMDMLLHNKKQIIHKERFKEKIWGFDSSSEYNAIEVYISFIRKKLSAINSDLKIRSVRSVGYILEVDE